MLARPVGASLRRFLVIVTLGLAVGALWMVARELVTFEHQARLLAYLANDISFDVEAGASPSIHFPVTGESDRRLGYTQLPDVLPALQQADFDVAAQARWSPRLERMVELGLNAPYRRKSPAGLVVLDRSGTELHRGQDGSRSYPDFQSIPPLLVQTLLFIENAELLDDRHRYRNPAVEWDRLARSLTLKAVSVIGPDRKTPGASTLATQLEKYHHSPGGRTDSAGEKLRQMLSASLRAYLDGQDTVATRQRIVAEYLNTVPLGAAPGYGEVHGLGTGLGTWFGADFEHVNALLRDAESDAAALAYRQVLTLLIAQRRPSYYLLQDRDGLAELTDTYLRLLARQGIVRANLLEGALSARVEWRSTPMLARQPLSQRKWPYFVRSRLTELMDVPGLYELDRWDMAVTTTVDAAVQAQVNAWLRTLADPVRARELGLNGHGLLGEADPAKVVYSVTLMEHVAGANLIRVQADTADRPLDINRGVKLDLGSTAKLRTLVTYLDTIARLHGRYRHESVASLVEARAARQGPLAAWVLDALLADPEQDLNTLLDDAMQRRYSANPKSSFFTGGGRHTFGNFDRSDDHRILTVSEAFHRSVNLVFIRMMADVVATHLADLPHGAAALADPAARQAYLRRFADAEGTEYLRRFHAGISGLPADRMLNQTLDKARASAASIAAVLASVDPNSGVEDLARQLDRRGLQVTDGAALAGLLERHGPKRLSLNDRAYVARVHPLELWLASRLFVQPAAPLNVLLAESADVRQEAYEWLLETRNRQTQDRRIRTMLEQEAFEKIHAFWQRLGYPFASLVPSLATAIGSSADQPGALTELLGIIAGDGRRYPTVYLTDMTFAAGTPYETRLRRRFDPPEQVLAPEVAAVTREALAGVVARGTARRLNGLAPEWAPLIGGKTGTGDHRFERHGAGGEVIESRVMNRTAVFSFAIGERFFGTVTAYVPGPEAAAYEFTSALPVQVLGLLLPVFEPLLGAPPASLATRLTAGAGPEA